MYLNGFLIVLGHPEGAGAGQAESSQVGQLPVGPCRPCSAGLLGVRGTHRLSTGVAGLYQLQPLSSWEALRAPEDGGGRGLVAIHLHAAASAGPCVLWGASPFLDVPWRATPGEAALGLQPGVVSLPAGASGRPGPRGCSPGPCSAAPRGPALQALASRQLPGCCPVLTACVLLRRSAPSATQRLLPASLRAARLHTLGLVTLALPALLPLLLQ